MHSQLSLAEAFPHLAEQWSDRNKLSPDAFKPRSSKYAWWRCPKVAHHEWQAIIGSRTHPTKPVGCPICAGQKVCPVDGCNSLAVLYPELALQWSDRNELPAMKISPESGKNAWWTCKDNPHHQWSARICSRAKDGSGCPICCNRIVCPEDACNSLWAIHPELRDEYDNDKNKRSMKEFMPGSDQKVWWKCKDHPHHSWEGIIANRTKVTHNRQGGCPICANRYVCPIDVCNSLWTVHPELRDEYDDDKNTKSMKEFTPCSASRVWWKCKKYPHHVWNASIVSRVSDNSGCPICTGKQICPVDACNSLWALRPDLRDEWNWSRNAKTMKEYTVSSGQYAHWICRINPQHMWKTTIVNRTTCKKTGCPYCKISHGESAVESVLNNLDIEYVREHRFDDCKSGHQ